MGACSTVVVPFTQQSIDEVKHNTERILQVVRNNAVNIGTLTARTKVLEEKIATLECPVNDTVDGLDSLRRVFENYMARKANSSSQTGWFFFDISYF